MNVKLFRGFVAIALFSLALIPVVYVKGFGVKMVYSVCYIYSTDLAAAEDYKSFLISYGIAVQLVNSSDAETWNYDGYSLIMIGSETGSLSTWEPSAAVPVIDGTGKPILGLGEGGYAFFGKLSLDIGYGNGGHESETRIYVVDPSHQIFNEPISITIPPDQIIELYTSTSDVAISAPSPEPTITLLGRDPDLPNHYPLIQEDSRYVLWGFYESPASMTQTGKDLFINLVLWLLGWSAPTSSSAAFIYSTDLTSAEDFETLLEANGITVDLVINSSAEAWDYSDYGLIIIGSDTGDSNKWLPNSAVSVIDGTGKPILGLGEGGYAFFGKLSLDIGYGNGAHGSDIEIYVVDPAHQIYHFPIEITVPPDNITQLYTTTSHVGIYLPSPEPGVTTLGREVGSENHYPLIQEDARYVLWGFTNSPSDMTQTGKDLFVNVAIWLLGEIIPEYSIPQLLLGALLAIAITFVLTRKQKHLIH